MGFNPFKAVRKIFKPAVKVFRAVRLFNFLGNINPFVALGIFAVGWLFTRSLKPDVPDFGTNDFEETEKGILVNKQSNNASIPIVYGEIVTGSVVISGAEGEINSIEEIRVDDKVVTFDGALTDNTQRSVASSDSNFFKADPNVEGSSAESTITIEPHFGTDGQSASSLLSSLSSWGSNHKLSGICYLALRFKCNYFVIYSYFFY